MAKINTNSAFKSTPIGMIPKDWDALRIKDFTSLNNSTINESNSKDLSFYYLDLSAVKQGKITFPNSKINFSEAPSRARRKLKPNNIIMATVRPNLLGFAVANFPTENFICSTGFALIEAGNSNEAQYIYQNLYSKSIINQIENLVVGSSYPAINNSDVENLIIPFPKQISERHKIAQILSTWDVTIETMQQLIAKKERHKKALMQKLLTGKIRFKEFKSEKRGFSMLSELIEKIVGGGTPPRDNESYWGGQIPWVTVKDMQSDKISKTQEYITETGLKNSASNLIKKGSIVLVTRMAVGKVAILNIDASINQDLKAITPKSGVDSTFIFYALRNNQSHLESLGSGSTVKGVVLSDVAKIIIPNLSLKEQQKIASVLSAADEEIQTLKTQLAHYKKQKQGLMQVLLTGKKRVTIR